MVVLGWLFVPIYVKAGVSQNSMLCFSLQPVNRPLSSIAEQVLSIAKPLSTSTRDLSMLKLYNVFCMYLNSDGSQF